MRQQLLALALTLVAGIPAAHARGGYYRDGRALRPTLTRYDQQKARLLRQLQKLPPGALRGGGIKLLRPKSAAGGCVLDTIRLPLQTKLAFLRVMERAARSPGAWEARPMGLGNPAWGLTLTRKQRDGRRLEVYMVSNSTFTGSGALHVSQRRGGWDRTTRVDHVPTPDGAGTFTIRSSSGVYGAMGDLVQGTGWQRARALDSDGRPTRTIPYNATMRDLAPSGL
jgi:hypothetical protein